MSGLQISEAVDLFSTLFQLSLWAAGIIAVGYVLAVVGVISQHFKKITSKLKLGGRR